MKTMNVTKMVRVFLAGLCLLLGLNFVSAPMVAFAKGESNSAVQEYDDSWLGGTGNGAFDSAEKAVKQTGNSAYKLVMAVAVVGLLLCIIVCGISIAFSGGNGNKRGEKLGWLVWIALGGCIIFGAISLLGLFQNIGMNLFQP